MTKYCFSKGPGERGSQGGKSKANLFWKRFGRLRAISAFEFGEGSHQVHKPSMRLLSYSREISFGHIVFSSLKFLLNCREGTMSAMKELRCSERNSKPFPPPPSKMV